MINRFTLKHIILTAKVYLLALGVFTLFRLILFFTNIDLIKTSSISIYEVFQSFLTGLRFDLVITGWIVLIPFLILSIIVLFPIRSQLPDKVIFYLLLVCFSVSFVICAVDIPFYNYFLFRLNATVFQWMDTPDIAAKLVIQEWRLIIYIIPLILLIAVFYFGFKKSFITFLKTSHKKGYIWQSALLSVCISVIIFIGIRGTAKGTIDVRRAFFSTSSFLNQLGLNPNFTLTLSLLEQNNKHYQTVQLMDTQEAIEQVQKYFSLETPDECSPVLRRIIPDTVNTSPPNVIIIIMERMAAARMTHFGSKKLLTPFLDSIANEGLLFENIYSAGRWTQCGIYSILSSYPHLFKQRPMTRNNSISNKYYGMASALKKCGYSTVYITAQPANFDNVEEFTLNIGFDSVIAQDSYPPEKIVNVWGVPDDFMFDFSIPVISKLHNEKRPFFVTFLTGSNHLPVYIPEYFTSNFKDSYDKGTEYADWSMSKFMKMASKEPWFDNTIFIFIADHGAALNDNYSVPLKQHHIPLIFYAPKLLKPEKYDCLGGQIDLFPTAMNLLQLPYTNNTMGIDLFSQKRKFMYFSSDEKYCAISDTLYLIVSKNPDYQELYLYRKSDKTNLIEKYQDIAKEMKLYADANLQVTQFMVSMQKTKCE